MVGIHSMFNKMMIEKYYRKEPMNNEIGSQYLSFLILITLLILIFLILLISTTVYGTWGHTPHDVTLEERKHSSIANIYVVGPNHPRIGNYNHYGVYIDGKQGWVWDGLQSGWRVPNYFHVEIKFLPNPSGSLTSEDSDIARAPKGGLVASTLTVKVGKWSVTIPSMDYISYSYDSSRLVGSWTDTRDYVKALLKDDFACWQAMYPYSNSYNRDQKVNIYIFVGRNYDSESFHKWGDHLTASFTLGDNKGGDDGYIDPVWKN